MADQSEQEATRIVDEVHNAPDADPALVCAVRKYGKPVDGQLHVFKVHKSVLAAASTVFEWMFETAGPQVCRAEGSEAEVLPGVNMEETIEVVSLVLGAAYQKLEALEAVADGQDWRLALEVWEAANKYLFDKFKVICSLALR